MKFEVLKLGKPKQEFAILAADYQKRTRKWLTCENRIIKSKHGRYKPKDLCLSKSQKKTSVFVFDQHAPLLTTELLAKEIQSSLDNRLTEQVIFLIGGAEGLDEATKKSADRLWSLSPCLYTSDITWLVVWEQIYRACTIIHGLPYHNAAPYQR